MFAPLQQLEAAQHALLVGVDDPPAAQHRPTLAALDPTANLLAGTAITMLRFKTDDSLPPDLAERARVTGRIAQVTARDAAEGATKKKNPFEVKKDVWGGDVAEDVADI